MTPPKENGEYRSFNRADIPCPPSVSKLYHDLYKVVDGRSAADASKIFVFCVAYTLYSGRKKDKIASISNNHDFNQQEKLDKIEAVYREFQPAHIINGLVSDAANIVKGADKDLQDKIISSIIEVSDDLKDKGFRGGLKRFFIETFWHIWILFAAFVFLILLANFIHWFEPTWIETVIGIVDEATKPF